MSETAAPVTYRTWMCVVCGFIYDEAKGQVSRKIAIVIKQIAVVGTTVP